MNEFLYKCEQCPRTFKLEEFYEKHKKVHELKKQHRCDICGFVYGAAKGLDGHMKTHSEAELTVTAVAKASLAAAQAAAAEVPPLDLNNFRFLSNQGVLASAPALAAPLPPPKVETKPPVVVPQMPAVVPAVAAAVLTTTPQMAPQLAGDVAPSPNGSGNYIVYGETLFGSHSLFQFQLRQSLILILSKLNVK